MRYQGPVLLAEGAATTDLGGMLVSPVFHGDPDAVAEALLADPGIAAADEIVLFLPPAFGLEENVRLLTDMTETVGPALGRTPAE